VITRQRTLACAAALALSLGATSPVGAQRRADCERQYTPQRGQEGKDVVWVPTEESMLGPMFELAKVTAADKIYDLGSGDGKIVIAAAKRFGATGVGIEYDADLVRHARCLAAAEGVADRVMFVHGDIFESDFGDATVVALYLTPQLNLRLVPRLLALKPGTRIVAYSFMVADWEPDDHVDSFGDGSVYLYIVPASVDGTWTFRQTGGANSFTVELRQTFQTIAGSANGAPVTAGKVSGHEVELRFTHGGQPALLMGTVNGNRIAATVTRGGVAVEYVGTRN
jgi:SAM-dependent methyltransferase